MQLIFIQFDYEYVENKVNNLKYLKFTYHNLFKSSDYMYITQSILQHFFLHIALV